MKQEELLEAYKTPEGRFYIVKEIMKRDSMSITEIVNAKETAAHETLEENRNFISGLAFRATAMFGETPKDTLKAIEQVKSLVAEDILKSGVVRGTEFEKRLLEQYPILIK